MPGEPCQPPLRRYALRATIGWHDMAPIVPNPARIKRFTTAAAFEAWLERHHDREPEVWLKIYKKSSGIETVSLPEALDIALCWGWIDAIRKSLDSESFLQRYCPRGARSVWSQINRDHVARLTAAGRMTAHGQRHVELAMADGRWDAAYAPMRTASIESLPDDLRQAIQSNPRAARTLETLNKTNLFALAFRTNTMKTPAGRTKKIAELVDMLARRATVVPQGTTPRKGR